MSCWGVPGKVRPGREEIVPRGGRSGLGIGAAPGSGLLPPSPRLCGELAGPADDDYDLFLLDAALANVVAASTNTQDGDDDPLEAISSIGTDHSGNRLVVVLFSGDDQFLQLNTHRGVLENGTDGQITGHAGAASAFAVAAANVAAAGGGPFVGGAANPVEPFSSDGPRRIFFDADGSPVPESLLGVPTFISRPKPDVTAADGVTTTTPGFTTFFGTSASVPHAAAIAARYSGSATLPSPPLSCARSWARPRSISRLLASTSIRAMASSRRGRRRSAPT